MAKKPIKFIQMIGRGLRIKKKTNILIEGFDKNPGYKMYNFIKFLDERIRTASSKETKSAYIIAKNQFLLMFKL